MRKKKKIQNKVLHLILRKPVNARRKLCKNLKISGKELKEPEEMTYGTTWNFPLLNTFLIPERKEKRRKKKQKIYFVNLWLLT